jgi:hypothetical protein
MRYPKGLPRLVSQTFKAAASTPTIQAVDAGVLPGALGHAYLWERAAGALLARDAGADDPDVVEALRRADAHARNTQALLEAFAAAIPLVTFG